MGRGFHRNRQPSLFGEPPPEPARQRVGAAPVSPDLCRIARRLPRNIYLGTSSWSFPGWQGLVYDRAASAAQLARHGLAAYARHCLLRAVGVDRTFYAPVPAGTFVEYAAAVPDDFRFTVKAHGLCTAPYHRDGSATRRNDRFLDPDYAACEVIAPFAEGLGAKAGPLVFQFSPLGARFTRQPQRFAERLAAFLERLPSGPRYAVELRDRELLCPEYSAALGGAGATHCVNLHPRMPDVGEQSRWDAAAGPLVVRWMLHRDLGYEAARDRYEPFSRLVDEDPENRSRLAELCLGHARRGHEVIVTANNKAEGSAPLTVFELAREITDRLPGDGD